MNQQSLNSAFNPRARRFRQLTGYLIVAGALLWVFHDIRFEELIDSMRFISWRWVALAVVLDLVSYCLQGVRWRLLLRPVGELSVTRAIQGVYVGLFASEVLPMRLGELVRAYLVSRWIAADYVAVFPSIAVERLSDGVWLALGTGLLMIFFPLPHTIMRAADILGTAVIAGTGVFIYLVFRYHDSHGIHGGQHPSFRQPRLFIRSLIGRFAEGLRAIGLSRPFFSAFFISLLFLALQILTFWFMMVAYGLSLQFWSGVVVALIIIIGTVIPNAPSNIGSFQFFCVVGLTLFGVDKTAAAGFSLISFVLLTIPLWVIGSIALGFSGMTLSGIRKELALLRNSTDSA